MHKVLIIFSILLVVFTNKLQAQDTLPKISVKSIGNKTIVSWVNNYGATISTINIQRSRDSLKNFTTIGAVLNPLNKENGFVDLNPSSVTFFYRVFVAFEGGTYLFSLSHHPAADTTYRNLISAENEINQPATGEENMTIIEETSTGLTTDNFLPKVKIPRVITPEGFIPSKFIYTNKENNLVINLPDAEAQKYSLKIFDYKNRAVLEIKKITESFLLMEKVNFIHSGWYYYSLYDDGIFLEKYKFYIGKETKVVAPPPPEGKEVY